MTKWHKLNPDGKETAFKALRTLYTDDPSDEPSNELKTPPAPLKKPWSDPKGVTTRKPKSE